jgi:hypothetical protein
MTPNNSCGPYASLGRPSRRDSLIFAFFQRRMELTGSKSLIRITDSPGCFSFNDFRHQGFGSVLSGPHR